MEPCVVGSFNSKLPKTLDEEEAIQESFSCIGNSDVEVFIDLCE